MGQPEGIMGRRYSLVQGEMAPSPQQHCHGEGGAEGAGAAVPQLFSYSKHDVFSNRMAIKVQRSGAAGQAKQRRGKPDKPEQLSTHRVEAPAPAQAASKQPQQQAERWSKPFSIEVIDTDGVLRVGGYELGIGIQAAPEPAVLTKVITFAPRYILRNRLRVGVAYRQHGTSEQARLLAPDEEVAFNWRSHRAEHLLELALSEEPAPGGTPAAREAARKSRFSHGFRLDELGELMLRCGTPSTLMEVVVECQRRRTPFNDFSAGGLLPTDYHGNR